MLWERMKKMVNSSAVEGKPKNKLPRPKEMLDLVGMHLVTKVGMDPDLVWKLYCVLRPVDGEKNRANVRVFSRAEAARAGISILNYDSLDAHPELIMFEGWIERKNRHISLEDRRPSRAA